MKKIFYNYGCMLVLIHSVFILSCKKDDAPYQSEVVHDIDGNIYHTVKICSQIWLVENLTVTRYRNGEAIPYKSLNQWELDKNEINTEGAFCNHNDSQAYGQIYGHLYNWNAVTDTRGIAPVGWHVPSEAEWEELFECLGGRQVGGGKAKEKGVTHWEEPNKGATDEFGFTALPGNFRISKTQSLDDGLVGSWWSSTSPIQCQPLYALHQLLKHDEIIFYGGCTPKTDGFSVRCIKD